MLADRVLKRRETLRLAGIAAAAVFGTTAARAVETTQTDQLPKGPKIAPPPMADDPAQDLRASEMAGLTLRVVKPGQAVTMEYREDRLTITVDAHNVIKSVRIG